MALAGPNAENSTDMTRIERAPALFIVVNVPAEDPTGDRQPFAPKPHGG
jgi:hypothetical protein